MKLIQSGVAVPQSRDSAAALQICRALRTFEVIRGVGLECADLSALWFRRSLRKAVTSHRTPKRLVTGGHQPQLKWIYRPVGVTPVENSLSLFLAGRMACCDRDPETDSANPAAQPNAGERRR